MQENKRKQQRRQPDESADGLLDNFLRKGEKPTGEDRDTARHKQIILRHQRSASDWRRTAKLLESDNRELLAVNELLTGVLKPAPVEWKITKPRKAITKNYATSISGMSDNHIEEIVLPEWVSFKNEHRLEIGLERCETFFKNVIRIYKYKSLHHKFVQHLAWNGGDHFTGHIRDDFKEVTECTPHEAIAQFVPLVVAGLRMWRSEMDCEWIDNIWSFSNHGRDTQEYKSVKEAEHSYDYLMALMVKAALTDRDGKLEDGFRFIIPKSYYYVVDVDGFRCRFAHGHKIRGGGGVGGIMIPLMKKLTRMNGILPADCDFMGHFHQNLNTPFLALNGSGIGYTPYAMNDLAAPYEPPQQSFWTIDMDRKVKRFDPIYLTKLKRSDPS